MIKLNSIKIILRYKAYTCNYGEKPIFRLGNGYTGNQTECYLD